MAELRSSLSHPQRILPALPLSPEEDIDGISNLNCKAPSLSLSLSLSLYVENCLASLPRATVTTHSAFLSVKKVTVKSEYTGQSDVEWALI